MRFRIVMIITLLMVLLSACNLGENNTPEPIDGTTPTNIPSGKPSVTIVSPQNGAEVAVNDVVIVSANATDSSGVTRVQLLANNQIVKTVSSESPTGSTNMNAALDYVPRTAGTVTLQVVSYRGATASDPASITIEVKSAQSQVTQLPTTINSGPSIPQIDPNDPTCRVLVNTGLNFRTGPGTNYDRIRVLTTGTVAPIVGRLGNNSWWQIQVGTSVGWVSAEFVTTYGNCFNVPVVNAPATPTPVGGVAATATPTLTSTPTSTVPPTATTTPGKADLVVVTINGPANITIPSGQSTVTQRYTVTISNTGTGPSRQFANSVTVQPGGSAVDLGVVANLDPNQTIALDIDLTFSDQGTYSVRVDTDSDAQVDELSEVNNNGTISVTVN